LDRKLYLIKPQIFIGDIRENGMEVSGSAFIL